MKTCPSKNVFNKNDYNSSDGMLTSVWGPSLWHSLHTISFNYPVYPTKEQKRHYLDFFRSLKHVLPCKYCRENYKKNIKTVPLNMPTMKSRETLSRWLYELHEEINKMLHKNSNLTYDQVRTRYEMFRARCINDKKGTMKKGMKKKKLKKRKSKFKNKKEKGCVKPLYGVKSKCVISIVPRNTRCKSFTVDKRCVLKRTK
jgi:hypothetical protein